MTAAIYLLMDVQVLLRLTSALLHRGFNTWLRNTMAVAAQQVSR